MPRYASRLWLVVLLCCLASTAGADDRTEPIDLMIALDRSLSMRQEIDAVKQYVAERIIDQILQPGDTLVMITFYGQNELAVFQTLTSPADREAIKRALAAVKADGPFTDIGFALDRLRDQVKSRCDPSRKKTLLLITDGIDEPPPESKYLEAGSWRSHEYMRIASETEKEGWKVIVLGVGVESTPLATASGAPPLAPAPTAPATPGTPRPLTTPSGAAGPGPGAPAAGGQAQALEQVARDLGGQYVQVGEKPTAGEIAAALPDLTGRMTVDGVVLSPMSRDGKAHLVVRLRTETYASQPQLYVSGVAFAGEGPAGPMRLDGLLGSPVIVPLPRDGLTEVHFDLRASPAPPPGRYRGELEFAFGGREQFPARQPAELRANSILQDQPWIVPAAIAAMAAAAAAILLAVRAARQVKMRLIVEEKPLPMGRDVFRLRKGRPAYLRESRDRFDISEVRTPKTIARLLASSSGVSLSRVKPERFPELEDDEHDVLGGRYTVRGEMGGTFHLRFERAQ